MKGFPNQIVDLNKLLNGLKCLQELIGADSSAKDDEIYGEALLRAKVIDNRKHETVDIFLAKQREKRPQDRSYRTSARSLRELFRLLALIDDGGDLIKITSLGLKLLASQGKETEQIWRESFWHLALQDKEGNISHPYQILLRLITKRHEMTRVKSPLALVAKTDSEAEIEALAKLVDQDEEVLRIHFGESKSNWDNAKKILPSVGIQLGDIVENDDRTYKISPQSPMQAVVVTVTPPPACQAHKVQSRKVTSETAAAYESDPNWEANFRDSYDPDRVQEGIALRKARTADHNDMVKLLAKVFEGQGAELHEFPFDLLARWEDAAFLCEMKTIVGTAEDERSQVRDALAQLLYYRTFDVEDCGKPTPLHLFAVFNQPISSEHQSWLKGYGIHALWTEHGQVQGGSSALDLLATRMSA